MISRSIDIALQDGLALVHQAQHPGHVLHGHVGHEDGGHVVLLGVEEKLFKELA